MHFSPPNAGNFNKIPEMARWQDGPSRFPTDLATVTSSQISSNNKIKG